MGYNMSKPELDPSLCSGSTDDGASSRQKYHRSFDTDHDIFHLTRLHSEPSGSMVTGMHGGRKLPISTVKMLAGREANCSGRGRFSSADSSHVLGRDLPVEGPWPVDRMDARAYVSLFSSDGSLFIAGFQGSHIRLCDVDNGWKVQKDILARSLRWTITDTSLSSHLSCRIFMMVWTYSVHEEGIFSFGIFSVKFSTDGRELVAGTSDDSIYVFDLEANKLTSCIPAHMYDVNTVTFADETGNLINSGSDDNLCKVWDRRCFTSRGKAAGILTGHLEGITFIDSRGDGRHFISNGKDQTTKLWDIRKLSSSSRSFRSPISGWDYRSMEYPPEAKQIKHPCDQSLATYRGHSVLHTLIRCYFSPAYSTGQRYIYTGSHDDSVYIYDVVTGAQVACLDGHDSTVRDCSWHPYYPMLVSSSWDGLIARWEFSRNDAVPVLTRKSWGRTDDQMFRAMYL